VAHQAAPPKPPIIGATIAPTDPRINRYAEMARCAPMHARSVCKNQTGAAGISAAGRGAAGSCTMNVLPWPNPSLRAEMLPLGSPPLLDLELFLAWRAQGLPIETPGVRR